MPWRIAVDIETSENFRAISCIDIWALAHLISALAHLLLKRHCDCLGQRQETSAVAQCRVNGQLGPATEDA
jgi:hypothetical protein